MFRPDEETWQRFLAATRGSPAWPRLVRAAELFQTPGDALDVGAGGGRDTKHLLERGWRVTAVDASATAAELLRELAPTTRLRVVHAAVEDFEPESYNLVNAQFSLPFVPPARFDGTLERLQAAVRPRGVMAATFFGPADEWNVPGAELTFTSRQQVEALFRDWELVELDHIEEDGTTATGGRKHWDVIHVIAQARNTQSGGGEPAFTENTISSVNVSPSTCSPKHPGPPVASEPNHALQELFGLAPSMYKPAPGVCTPGTTATPCWVSFSAAALASPAGTVSVRVGPTSPPSSKGRMSSGPEYRESTIRIATCPPEYQLSWPDRYAGPTPAP